MPQDREDSSVASSILETESSNVSSSISVQKSGAKPMKQIKKLAGKFISLVTFHRPGTSSSKSEKISF